jgi:hypothetical protein
MTGELLDYGHYLKLFALVYPLAAAATFVAMEAPFSKA